MPKFRYQCKTCNVSELRLVSNKDKQVLCKTCQTLMDRQMPNLVGQEVRETVDPLLNTSWKQDQKDILKERKEDYYWSVEVPRLVQTHGLQTCLEQGWVWIDDKGQMHVHTKPPGKR
jgi:hypothetical protein